MKLLVVEAHTSNYPNPICFSKGDLLVTGKKDSEYEGWIWVTTADGNQGWAPVQCLEIREESGKAVAKQDYTARELNTSIGDELILHYVLNDWGWVENADGACGWVPMKTTRRA